MQPNQLLLPLLISLIKANKNNDCNELLLTLSDPKPIYSSYIFSFKSNTPTSVIESAKKEIICSGGTIDHVYDLVLNGFSATMPQTFKAAFLSEKAYNSYIQEIENDGVVSIAHGKKSQGKNWSKKKVVWE
ncbi:hypothetical protein K502DRAFT_347000 [Neoconidiobolus thromboides FSU 785]|nr:hypothetical protein K502DRAFT_347000 [Neoconidiobolus thromboides FSU 785]